MPLEEGVDVNEAAVAAHMNWFHQIEPILENQQTRGSQQTVESMIWCVSLPLIFGYQVDGVDVDVNSFWTNGFGGSSLVS